MRIPFDSPPTNILVVDDVEENLTAIEIVLEREEATLLKARSGREALEILLSNDIALAIIDVQMPDMDGFELAESIRGDSRTSSVPIIFVTAGVRDPTRMFRGYDAGAVDFLYKPFEPYILRHKTNTFLQLDRQRRALEQALQVNEEMMEVVGHELRSPLQAILMTGEWLAATATDETMVESARRIQSSGMRMVQMINELLDLSHARLGGIPIEAGPADLGVLADQVVSEQRAFAPSRVLEFERDGDLLGIWDSARLARALSTLVGNAIRRGDPKSPITIEARSLGDEVVLSVHDGGHIRPELVPRVFDAFLSTQTPRRTNAVYIVQQIARAHGGTVKVESAEHIGTTFRIRLPRKCEASAGK